MAEENNEVMQHDDAADFAASFASVRDDASPADTVSHEKVVTAQQEHESAPVVSGDGESDAASNVADKQNDGFESPAIAGLTEAQAKELFAKAARFDELSNQLGQFQQYLAQQNQTLQKVTGKLGEFERFKQEIAKQPKPQGLNLSAATFGKLAKDYPDIAAALADDLQSLPVAQQSQPVDFNRDEIEQHIRQQVLQEAESKMQARMAEYNMNAQKQMLRMQFGDWEDIVRSPDFSVWTGILPAEQSHEIRSTGDAAVLANALLQFKQWQQQTAKAQETKQTRLANAVQPSGLRHQATREVKTDLDDFLAEFNNVRGSRL
jgi:hypothetical protein